MKTEWDYSELAKSYLNRPDYSKKAIDKLIDISDLKESSELCDIGAGVAHLTLMLADYNYPITAIEPNDEMRKLGILRTQNLKKVKWIEGIGEDTQQKNNTFSLVTFGSSFNVCDRKKALRETSRILIEGGRFACMWNHRNLDDPIQSKIEEIIKDNVNNYDYGNRREDQTNIIKESNFFNDVTFISEQVIHTQNIKDCITAWKSHATLERQAGQSFGKVISKIEDYLNSLSLKTIEIPYTTNIWTADLK